MDGQSAPRSARQTSFPLNPVDLVTVSGYRSRMRAASLILSTLGILALVACKSTPRQTRADGYVPAELQCDTVTDPTCLGEATAGVSVPLPHKPMPAPSQSAPPPAPTEGPEISETAGAPGGTLVGSCELYVDGESGPRSCQGIHFVLRATRENEVRNVVIDGNVFRAKNLNNEPYRLEASSADFDLTTENTTVTPGQNVKIRVRAKRKP